MDKLQIVHGVTNSAATSDTTVQLGDRTFKLVHLPYDDYTDFICLAEPVLKSIMQGLSNGFGDSLAVEATSIVKPLLKTLPEIVFICLKQTDPNITISEIKTLAKSPMPLAKIVVAQAQHNGMIQEFSDFFAQMATMLKAQ